jgi:NAD(P)-dependent dehydrogenase (short-subunit alcohol dehydrogenase family)
MAAPARKVALVTAGSAGLGAAIARVLALELSMSVTINYNSNADRAHALVQELQTTWASRHAVEAVQAPPPVFHAIQADICKKSEIIRLVEETTAASGGRLDAVVSNVGWTRMRNFADLEDGVDEEDWDRCFGANVKSHLWLFHAAKKWLEESNGREEGAAVFVSTASIAGVKPSGSSLVCDEAPLISHDMGADQKHKTAIRGDQGRSDPPHQVPGYHRRAVNTRQLCLARRPANGMSSPPHEAHSSGSG